MLMKKSIYNRNIIRIVKMHDYKGILKRLYIYDLGFK